MSKKVLFAGGGTGGHIYPAIAIAKGLEEKMRDVEIVFVGTERGMEMDLVPKAGFRLEKIRVRGFKRKLSFDTFLSFKEMFIGGIDSIRILKKEKPQLVIGTGGYVAGPVVFFATLMGIPTLIHEQNVKPGITNRILGRFVDKIAISFIESVKYFPSSKCILTGNPVRPEIISADKKVALKNLNLKHGSPVVLSFGGSQGAKKLNEAVIELIELIKDREYFQLLHITGQKNYERFLREMELRGINWEKLGYIKIKPYLYNMHDALACADLVVSRAGAITISEITACGRPAILIPLPTAADNHQDFNARYLEKNNAALVIEERLLSGNILYEYIMQILNDKEKYRIMSEASKKLGKPDALNKIVDIAVGLLS